MSKLHIKQVAGPVGGVKAPTGAIPVFDGNLVRWSNSATTGLQIPTGSTAQRPGGAAATDGLLRYNTDLNKVELRENGAWSNVLSGIKSFLDLTDAPKTYTGSAGKVLAVKADGTGLEYIDPTVTIDKITGTTAANAGKYVTVKSDGSGLQYSPFPAVGNMRLFKIRFNLASGGQYLDSTTPCSEMPDGWSAAVSGSNNSILTITHTAGSFPHGAFAYGYDSTSNYFKNRPIGSTSFELRHFPGNTTSFVIYSISNLTTGASQGAYGYITVWFPAQNFV